MAAVLNTEEAANIAAEFIYSLDNIPNEVNFLLAEIRYRDERSQEILAEIHKRGNRYIRHSLGDSSKSSTPDGSTSGIATPIVLSSKDSQIPQKVVDDFAEIDRLAGEKIDLSKRLTKLVLRARTRLDLDLGAIMVMSGEMNPDQIDMFPRQNSLQIQTLYDTYSDGGSAPSMLTTLSAFGITPAPTVVPNAVPPATGAPPVPPSATAQAPPKRRRLNASNTGTITLSPAPSAAPTASRSRPPGQGRVRRPHASVGLSENDMEGDPTGDGGDDDSLYCICQNVSYGEMIACDARDCPYQWFHLDCVGLDGLRGALPDSWWCENCRSKREMQQATRKRNRK